LGKPAPLTGREGNRQEELPRIKENNLPRGRKSEKEQEKSQVTPIKTTHKERDTGKDVPDSKKGIQTLGTDSILEGCRGIKKKDGNGEESEGPYWGRFGKQS